MSGRPPRRASRIPLPQAIAETELRRVRNGPSDIDRELRRAFENAGHLVTSDIEKAPRGAYIKSRSVEGAACSFDDGFLDARRGEAERNPSRPRRAEYVGAFQLLEFAQVLGDEIKISLVLAEHDADPILSLIGLYFFGRARAGAVRSEAVSITRRALSRARRSSA